MTIGCGRVLVHHATIWAERYLLSLVVIIIDGHPGQEFRLVELVNHILPFILEWHIWGYDGYQWAISLSVEEWAQARYLLGDTSSGVQGQPFVFIFEGIGLALGQVTLAVEVVDPMFTYNSWRTSFVNCPPQSKVWRRVKILLGGLLSFLKTEDSGMDFLDFRKVFVIQLKPEGPVEAVVSASLASNFFLTLEGVAPSLELLVAALLPRFLSLQVILTLRPRGGGSFSGVSSSVLSESVLEASVTCSWTC